MILGETVKLIQLKLPVAFHFYLKTGLKKTYVILPPTVSRSSNKYNHFTVVHFSCFLYTYCLIVLHTFHQKDQNPSGFEQVAFCCFNMAKVCF